MREGVLIIRNTVTIAVGKIIVGQIVSIAFAIAIFQIALKWFRRPRKCWLLCRTSCPG